MYTEEQKNAMVKQYEPLINKLTKQFYNSNSQMGWDAIKSMAYEGFAIAMNTYDETRSSMKFTSFAAYAMRNKICDCLTEESRTVRMSYEEQQRRKANGETLFTSVSIDQPYDADDGLKPREMVMGTATEERFDMGIADDNTCWNRLFEKLSAKFNPQELEMLYRSYGLNGYEEMPNQDIAKMFGVTPGLVSQKKKKIIDYIRKDEELFELLATMI